MAQMIVRPDIYKEAREQYDSYVKEGIIPRDQSLAEKRTELRNIRTQIKKL